jgi:hypothetical protein
MHLIDILASVLFAVDVIVIGFFLAILSLCLRDEYLARFGKVATFTPGYPH